MANIPTLPKISSVQKPCLQLASTSMAAVQMNLPFSAVIQSMSQYKKKMKKYGNSIKKYFI